MKRATIIQRLILLTAIPVTALVLSSGTLIWESFGRYQDAALAQKVMAVAVAAGDLIHPMQVERGMTTAFIQSKGQRFADTLPDIRAKTDERLASYKRLIEGMDTGSEPLKNAIREAQRGLDGLAGKRGQASQFSIPPAESFAFFTAIIDKLLDVQGVATRIKLPKICN